MAAPTRYPGGVTNVRKTSPTGMLPIPDPVSVHQFHTDFDAYTAAQWTVTLVGTGAAALTNGDGGILAVATTGANTDATSLQKVGEGFSFEIGKATWFKARFSVSALTSVVVLGLQVTDTTPEDVTDGIYFLSTTATGAVTAYVRQNATTGSTSVAAGTLVAGTYTELAFYWDGKDTVTFYQDGVVTGSIGSITASNYLPDTTTTPSFAIRTTTAAVKTMNVDYIQAIKAR